MGHLLSSLLVSISSNTDSFATGIAYGVKKLRIGKLSNLTIASISAFGTYISLSIGTMIGRFLSVDIANLIGSVILIILGILGIIDAIKPISKKSHKNNKFNKENHHFYDDLDYTVFIEEPEKADIDKSNFIDIRESVTLALALTVNNLSVGVGGGISKLNIPVTTSLTFIFSILAISGGYSVGEKFAAKISGKWAGIVSGLCIICIGFYEYFT